MEIEGVVLKEARQLIYADRRGWLAEVARSDEDGEVPMVYCSLTAPGVIRGPHEHCNQTDRFVFIGKATVWLWDNRKGSPTKGARAKIEVALAAKIVVPPGVVHAYRNDGKVVYLTVVNAPDQLYKGRARQEPVDEVRHEDDPANKFNPW